MDIARVAADRLLTCTRSVRRRLDVSRPVDLDVVRECLTIAQQAPASGGGAEQRWIVVTDPGIRTRLGEIYRRACEKLRVHPAASGPATAQEASEQALAVHMGEVPVLMVPCFVRRPWHDKSPYRDLVTASVYGSVYPAVWSFQLALRSRGLGSCFVAAHLRYAEEVAELLGLPDDIGQAGMVAAAHVFGDTFRPARRPPLDQVMHHDRWQSGGQG